MQIKKRFDATEQWIRRVGVRIHFERGVPTKEAQKISRQLFKRACQKARGL